MNADAFDKVCDRLASALDPAGHERRRWAKDEGAKLDKVAELIQQIFATRDDFDVQPASQTLDARGFILTLEPHQKVAHLTVKLSRDAIAIWPVEVEGGIATVSPRGNIPGLVPLEDITPSSVGNAVANALSRISV